MKRILIFAGYFYPHVGGYEKSILDFSSRLVKMGYGVDIVTGNTNRAAECETIEGVRVYRVPCWNALGGTYPIPYPSIAGMRICKGLWKNRYAVINTQTRFFVTSCLGMIAAGLKGVPLVHTEHGSRHSALSNRLAGWLARVYDHTLGTRLVRSARQNIAVSEAAGQFLKHLKAQRITVIPNGIDLNRYCRRENGLKAKLGLSENCPVITFTGRLIFAKGVQDLIEVIPVIKQIHPELKVLVAGDGGYKTQLEALAEKKGCAKEVVFLGEMNQDEIIDILSISDIFVNPSYSEGLPSSVMEAAGMGLPVIATEVGGTAEMVINGETGILIQPGDQAALAEALLKLMADAGLRKQYGESARELTADRFNWDKIIQQMVNLLEDCARRRDAESRQA